VVRAARRLVGPFLLFVCVVSWLTWPLATAGLGRAHCHDRADLELLAASDDLLLFRVTDQAVAPP